MTSKVQKHTHIGWIDATKGFAILLVVIGHVWGGIHARGLLGNHVFGVLDSRIYAFHMPLFFVLSGLFFVPSLAKFHPTQFITNRLTRLLWPLLLWTYIFIFIKLLAGSATNTALEVSDLFQSPIPGRWHFWFLWALLLIQLSFIPLRKLVTNPSHSFTSPLVLLGISVGLQMVPMSPNVYLWVGQAIQMSPYFMLGIIIGPRIRRIGVPARAGATAFVVFCAILIGLDMFGTTSLVQLVIGAVLSICCLIIFAAWFHSDKKSMPVLIKLGQASMAIYLTHTIFSATLREALLSQGITNVAIHFGLGVLVGVALPVVLFDLALRTGSKKVLGF